MAEQPCLVSGRYGATVHHVRRNGEPKKDRRTVPLLAEYHMHDFGTHSIERLGKVNFEAHHSVDLEAAIVQYNRLFDALHA